MPDIMDALYPSLASGAVLGAYELISEHELGMREAKHAALQVAASFAAREILAMAKPPLPDMIAKSYYGDCAVTAVSTGLLYSLAAKYAIESGHFGKRFLVSSIADFAASMGYDWVMG
mgnify:CR=1 FL=1